MRGSRRRGKRMRRRKGRRKSRSKERKKGRRSMESMMHYLIDHLQICVCAQRKGPYVGSSDFELWANNGQ